MSDTLIFDIETSNFFTDPEVGRDNYNALRISVVGAYSYAQDKYFCYEESEMDKLAELFDASSRIVGFSINRYDVPVLNLYFQKLKNRSVINLWNMERVDLAEIVEAVIDGRISLSRLAEANLGVKKDRHPSEAISLFRHGRMDELKEYCLKDVRITKEIYDLYSGQGHLWIPNKKTGIVDKVNFASPAAAAPLA
ncbi:MAG: ribonuclease H-like domain-containing protein [bacterium]|nr:ribonuclease H-like domain-containing protein [bacterium]